MTKTIFGATLAAVLVTTIATSPAFAVEEYSPGDKLEFLDWCTTKGEGQSDCVCALRTLESQVEAEPVIEYIDNQDDGMHAHTATKVSTSLNQCKQ